MNNKGVTLIELMVVLVIMGIVFGMVYQNFFYQEKFLRRQRQWAELNIKARKASTYITKELRMIGYSNSSMGDAFGIADGNANSITYTHDVDGLTPGVVDKEDIHSIEIRADTLYIDGDFALDDVDSLHFTYTDTTETEVSPPVCEVDTLGQWILPTGNYPIAYIGYTLALRNPYHSSGDTMKTVISYKGLAALRNERP